MTEDPILWEAKDGVGRITLNRPDRLNAWDSDFGDLLREVVTERATAPEVRAVLVTGAGRAFSSGADLKAGFEPHPDDELPDVRKRLEEVYHPLIVGCPAAREAGGRGRERPGGRDRMLARSGLRPGAGGAVRLLHARLRWTSG